MNIMTSPPFWWVVDTAQGEARSSGGGGGASLAAADADADAKRRAAAAAAAAAAADGDRDADAAGGAPRRQRAPTLLPSSILRRCPQHTEGGASAS